MNIRPAELADGDSLFTLAQRFATSFTVAEAAFRSSFADILSDPTACLLVVESGVGVTGYVLGYSHPSFFANGRVAWVEEIMVAEGSRRRGAGKQLMEGFAEWATARGCRLVALATRRAEAFYKAIGYEESAVYFRKVLA